MNCAGLGLKHIVAEDIHLDDTGLRPIEGTRGLKRIQTVSKIMKFVPENMKVQIKFSCAQLISDDFWFVEVYGRRVLVRE
jgi:hypothetical protein